MCLDATVFLIEDDVAVRDALSISLRMAGLIVEAYSSGKAFLETCNDDRRGCLLINLSQGEMGGLTDATGTHQAQCFDPNYFYDRNRDDPRLFANFAGWNFLLTRETLFQIVAA